MTIPSLEYGQELSSPGRHAPGTLGVRDIPVLKASFILGFL